MLNTVLFDMGGTLEDIWNNQETQAKPNTQAPMPLLSYFPLTSR